MASRFKGSEKAAIFLMSLPKAEASAVLKHMGASEVHKIGQAMASMHGFRPSDYEAVMNDFMSFVECDAAMETITHDHIRSLMIDALGENKAHALMDKVMLGADAKGIDALRMMDPRDIAEMLHHEHPQIKAILLSLLDAPLAANVMAQLDTEEQVDITMRISMQENIHAGAVKELNEMLANQLANRHAMHARQVGGMRVAANILNQMPPIIESEIMDKVKRKDESLGQSIEDLLFVFDDLAQLHDRYIQTVLREISSDILIVALKGAETPVKEKIFKNMSTRAAELLQEDLQARGPVRLSEVDAAQKAIIKVVRKLNDRGDINLGQNTSEDVIT